MKPAARRRVEREIKAIMDADGDRCSLCNSAFQHNCRTFGGITPIGKSALVSECCRARLGEVILSGLYVNQDYHDLPPFQKGDERPTSTRDVENAIAGMQAVFGERAAVREGIAKRAGVDPARTRIFVEATDWKTDDANWFEAHPSRSHRLRSLIGSEATSFGAMALQPMRQRHELQVLVRQIMPGQRMRVPFGRNLDIPIPDDEVVLHALFDAVAERRDDQIVSASEVLRMMAARRPQGGPSN